MNPGMNLGMRVNARFPNGRLVHDGPGGPIRVGTVISAGPTIQDLDYVRVQWDDGALKLEPVVMLVLAAP